MKPTTEKTTASSEVPVTAHAASPLVPREKAESTAEGSYSGRWFEPAVDISETDEALTLRADLPGIAPEDVETELRDNLLTLTAKVKPEVISARTVWREYDVGHYIRQFRLGQQIDQSKISAQMKDGVLTLTLPKAEAARPRKIQIQQG